MRLEKFLKLEKLSIPEFAEMIGVNKSAVFRYIHEDSIPKAPVMTRIYLVTRGAVSANDFYRLTDQIFDVELKKGIFLEKNYMLILLDKRLRPAQLFKIIFGLF